MMSTALRAFGLAFGVLSLALGACNGQIVIGNGEGNTDAGGEGGTVNTGPGSAGQPCKPSNVCNSGLSCNAGTCTAPHQIANKVDLLFDIDNSASMGDKQAFLAAAVPDLITRLVQPNCVVTTNSGGSVQTTIAGLSNAGSCAAYPGSTIEFAPVHDMHIGVISSSLGTRGVTGGGAVCDPAQMTNAGMPFLGPTPPPTPPLPPIPGNPSIPSHTDDQAHLLNRVPNAPVTIPMTTAEQETETTLADTGGQAFLDWFPTGAGWSVNNGHTATEPAPNGPPVLMPVATDIMTAAQLESDFQELIIGAHFYGCGIESQLESWYRFLVQPDPYLSIAIDSQAEWSAVDATIIQQRHDFLRPDSLVAIIDLSDENDSEIDVRSFGGQGYKFMDETFQPPRGTSACESGPGDPECTSCAYGGATTSDPNCMMGPYIATNDPGFYINVRHVHMQQKYGIVPQFPLGRYVLGLTSPKVPDRTTEYPSGANCYQGGIGNPACGVTTNIDTSKLNCTNPLFAATLPDGSELTPAALCNSAGAGGQRTPGLIFYAHIGGVPHQLLLSKPGDETGLCPTGSNPADCPQKDTLDPSDWVNILGQGWNSPPTNGTTNPNQYNYTGIDPHMVEGFGPRPGLVTLSTGPKPKGGGSDPINGGEWVTNTTSPSHVLPVDREYACIFPLPAARDCSNLMDYATQEQCDCSIPGLPLDAVPSVCGLKDPSSPYAMGTNDYTTQYYAKAYPTIRELQLAELLGPQGVVSSLCPIHTTDNAAGNDPLYGYRPAATALVARMKAALAAP
jgi:hypothetical protein